MVTWGDALLDRSLVICKAHPKRYILSLDIGKYFG